MQERAARKEKRMNHPWDILGSDRKNDRLGPRLSARHGDNRWTARTALGAPPLLPLEEYLRALRGLGFIKRGAIPGRRSRARAEEGRTLDGSSDNHLRHGHQLREKPRRIQEEKEKRGRALEASRHEVELWLLSAPLALWRDRHRSIAGI